MLKGVIVCVDDEQLVLISLRDQLLNYLPKGYEVELAESGVEALEIFEELHAEGIDIPVIICDQIMPNMRGDELLVRLHATYPQTLKILLTGQADVQAVGNIINKASLYRYLTKPWHKTDLLLTVTEALRRYFKDKELLKQTNALHKSETRLRTIVNMANEAIITIDQFGVIQSFNLAAERIFGYTAAEAIGQNVSLLMPLPYKTTHNNYMTHYRQTGQKNIIGASREVIGQHKEGRLIPLNISVSEVHTDDEWFIIGIIYDITDRKQAEKEKLKLSAIQHELDLAYQIQQNLLPPTKPNWPNLDVRCYNIPAHEVGGDFYAYHAFDTQFGLLDTPAVNYVLAIGDVSGKGMPAALLMAVSLAWFQATVQRQLSPTELLDYLNTALQPYTKQAQQNCALVYAEISSIQNPEQSYLLRFANAGCIPPYIKRANGEVEHYEIGSFALGQILNLPASYQQLTMELSKGDLVILISDGIVEANNNQKVMLGFNRFMQIVKTGPTSSAEAMLTHIKQAIFAFTNQAKQYDDMTIIVAKI